MALIRCSCPACGDPEVSLGPKAVTLCPTGERPWYAFVCPACGESVEKDADDRIIRLLTEVGVTMYSDPIYPEEIAHPELPAITWDDLIDFHRELEDMPLAQ